MSLIFEAHGVRLARVGNRVTLDGGRSGLMYDLDAGLFSYVAAGRVVLRDARAEASVQDGGRPSSTQGRRELSAWVSVEDPLGRGVRISVSGTGEGSGLVQHFTVYGRRPEVLTCFELSGPRGVSTRYMAPVIAHGGGPEGVVDLGACTDPRALYVPYDNDYWVRYVSCPLRDARPGYTYPDDRRPRNEEMYKEGIKQGYEVAVVFDSAGRQGLIIASVLHDTWKTGIKITGNPQGGVSELEVYGGCADRFTRDYLPHAPVRGDKVVSPTILLAWCEDWRDGLEEIGRACAALTPPMAWEGGPIFGWNAYAAYEGEMDYERFIHTSHFLKEHLQGKGFSHDGVLYMNFDYRWGNLTEEQLVEVVKVARANNQRAGIYYTPFSAWTDNLDEPVEGTEGRYVYRDILLRDYEGIPLPKVNGGTQGYAVDPTHPGTLKRMEYMFNRFVKWGFDFVKLDFIAAGALEGSHHEKSVQTGKQAYNYAMREACRLLDPVRIGRPFFVSLSIAPAFPYYGHARRISCDVFGHISDSEYMLNSLSYGWWMANTIYRFNDPDLIVINRRLNHPSTTEQEAKTRINSGVICGGLFLNSDAMMDPVAGDRAIRLLSSESVTSIVKKGGTFRPVEGNSGDGAVDWFYRDDASELYVAVFNYDRSQTARKVLDLARIGGEPKRRYVFVDAWTGARVEALGTLTVVLAPSESAILCARKS